MRGRTVAAQPADSTATIALRSSSAKSAICLVQVRGADRPDGQAAGAFNRMLLSRVPHRRLGLDAHAGAHESAESGAGRCVPRLFRALHVVCCMPNVACRTLCCMDNSGSASPCWHLPDAGMMSCAASVWYPGMISCSARSCMLRGVRHSAVCCMRSMLQRTRLCAACLGVRAGLAHDARPDMLSVGRGDEAALRLRLRARL